MQIKQITLINNKTMSCQQDFHLICRKMTTHIGNSVVRGCIQTMKWVQNTESVEARSGQGVINEEVKAPGDAKQDHHRQQGRNLSFGCITRKLSSLSTVIHTKHMIFNINNNYYYNSFCIEVTAFILYNDTKAGVKGLLCSHVASPSSSLQVFCPHLFCF